MSWDLTGFVYDTDFLAMTNGTWGFTFDPTGTYLYNCHRSSSLDRWTLATPWLLASATLGTPFNSAQVLTLNHVAFDSTGTKMYLLDQSNGGAIFQYTLGTAWDITTAVYAAKSLVVGFTAPTPQHITFKPDGTVLYVTVQATVYQYALSTAWDITTGTYTGKSHAYVEDNIQADQTFLKPDGLRAWMVGSGHNGTPGVWQYTLGTAWDISTLTYTGISAAVGAQETTPRDMFIRSDGLKLFVVGTASNKSYRYSLRPDGGLFVGKVAI